MKIAYFAPIYFEHLKQRPQHIAELLSKKHEVYYIEPTISLMKYILKGGKSYRGQTYDITLSQPKTNRGKSENETQQAAKNPCYKKLHIIRVNGCMTLHKSLEAFDFLNVNTISEWMQLKNIIDHCDIIWVGYSGWYSLVKRFKNKRLIYDKMDDDTKIATNPFLIQVLKKAETGLIKRADKIFVTCNEFYKCIKPKNHNVVLVRNGVTLDFSDGIWKEPNHPPHVFGYVGTISHWFDFEVLKVILKADAKNRIILVGENVLPKKQNSRIEYRGIVEKSALPKLMESFDVCLYNFKQMELLNTINPVKVYEYLSLNQPTLAVRSEETQLLSAYCMLYHSMDEVRDFLKQKLTRPFSTEEERQVFLKDNSWEARIEVIEKHLDCHSKADYDSLL